MAKKALALRVPVAAAESARKALLAAALYDSSRLAARRRGFVYFPVLRPDPELGRVLGASFVRVQLPRARPKQTLREALSHLLKPEQFALLRRAFDVIGDIAIIELPRPLARKGTLIGRALLKTQPGIKAVFAKASPRAGVFRLQRLRWLAGRKGTVTRHRESSLTFELDIAKVYFSPRLAGERLRIARQVHSDERVLVMFSGVAPYPAVLSRWSGASQIVGVELNPVAHAYGLRNISLNKLTRIELYQGDVRRIVPALGLFDRIIMPLPFGGQHFLGLALAAAAAGATVHFYIALPETKLNEAEALVQKACAAAARRCTILRVVRAGQPAPRTLRLCVDFRVL